MLVLVTYSYLYFFPLFLALGRVSFIKFSRRSYFFSSRGQGVGRVLLRLPGSFGCNCFCFMHIRGWFEHKYH